MSILEKSAINSKTISLYKSSQIIALMKPPETAQLPQSMPSSQFLKQNSTLL
jgi:hypothetical protein